MRIYLLLSILFAMTPVYCQFSFVSHHYNIPNGGWVNHVATGDFNGDGKPDVITAGTYPGDATSAFFYIFLSNAADSLDTGAVLIPYRHPYLVNEVTGMAVGDMNHDNLDDIVIATYDSLYVYYQNPNHSFTCSRSSRYGQSPLGALRIADIDQDDHNDIIIGSVGAPLAILYGTAVTDSFVLVTYPASTLNVADLILGKIGRDTTLSIISMPDFVNSAEVTAIKIKPNRQLNTVTDFHIAEISFPSISGIATGDRFGDGNNEMEVISLMDTLIQWTHPDTDTTSDAAFALSLNQSAQYPFIEDMNCDGKGEVILAGPGNAIQLMDYAGNFYTVPLIINNNLDYDDMAVANVIGDVKPDIIVANTYGGVTVLENRSLSYDSSFSHTDTVGIDTSHVQTSFNTLVVADTVYRHGDTLVLRNDSVKIYYGYIDSTLAVVISNRSISRCNGDTLLTTDTTHSLISQSFLQDTVLLATLSYDTLFITGVQQISVGNLRVFPDPFTSGINVQGVEENALVELYSLTGDLLLSAHCAGNCYIPRNNLAQGLYILKVINNNKVICLKISAL